MIFKDMIKLVIGIAIIYSLVSVVYATFDASVAVGNLAPEIVSVRTFSSYVDDSDNVPETSFNFPNRRTVYIQVKARDDNGFQDIHQNGFVKVRIVLWNGSSETNFARFPSYVNANFESGSGKEVIYTYVFVMGFDDQSRSGTGVPPLYYRVKAQVSDGEYTVTSNLSSDQNADYTYQVSTPPGPSPIPILFDITIDIPENNRVVEPGDSFYATVTITKVSPPGVRDIQVNYQIIDPADRIVDPLTETVAVNNTIYRVPVLYIPLDAIPGRYRFRATVSYEDVQVWSEATFTVQIPGVTTTTTIPVTTTTVPGVTTTTVPVTTTTIRRRRERGVEEVPVIVIPPAVMKREISIYRYPHEVYVFKGELKPLLVIVENTGDLTLNDVTVYIGGPVIIDKIVPEEIDNMEPDSRRSFIIEVSIPSDLATGDYDLILKAIAEHATDERHIRFVVLERPSEPERELRRQIEELSKLLDAIWGETVETGLKGIDVKDVFRSLRDAKTSIDKANEYWMNGRYDKTRTAINDARDYIEKSVIALAIAKPEKKEIKEIFSTKEITVYVLPLLYWIFAIISILVILLLVYDRFKRGKPGRRLEEKYELLRMKDQILGRKRMKAGGLKGSVSRPKKGYSDKAILGILKDRIKGG